MPNLHLLVADKPWHRIVACSESFESVEEGRMHVLLSWRPPRFHPQSRHQLLERLLPHPMIHVAASPIPITGTKNSKERETQFSQQRRNPGP